MTVGANRVVCLDGMRGLAALWVLTGHSMLLTGFVVPFFGQPDLGVDLFILLSGFLMVFQYQSRQDREDWDRPATWFAFWVRRFFRISPLYYLMLVIALTAGPTLYADRLVIDHFLGNVHQQPERYLDGGIANLLAHISYMFGLIPSYAYRTPLPDWSIGLEMQFYAAFPAMILLIRRFGWPTACLALGALGVAISTALFLAHVKFPMPTFLPMKLQLFLAGMLLAADYETDRRRLYLHLGTAMVLAAIPVSGGRTPLHIVVRELLVLIFFVLVNLRAIGVADRVSRLLGSKPFYWLGELSYGTYLIHLLILQPVASWAILHGGRAWPEAVRFAVVFLATAAISYSLALVGYHALERPGQKLGSRILKTLGARRGAIATPAENIAAP